MSGGKGIVLVGDVGNFRMTIVYTPEIRFFNFQSFKSNIQLDLNRIPRERVAFLAYIEIDVNNINKLTIINVIL